MTLAQLSRYFRDPEVPGWRKFLLLGAALYVVMPLDLIPDVVPILGWLDDVGVVGAAVMLLRRDVARHSLVACARRAEMIRGT